MEEPLNGNKFNQYYKHWGEEFCNFKSVNFVITIKKGWKLYLLCLYMSKEKHCTKTHVEHPTVVVKSGSYIFRIPVKLDSRSYLDLCKQQQCTE